MKNIPIMSNKGTSKTKRQDCQTAYYTEDNFAMLKSNKVTSIKCLISKESKFAESNVFNYTN